MQRLLTKKLKTISEISVIANLRLNIMSILLNCNLLMLQDEKTQILCIEKKVDYK